MWAKNFTIIRETDTKIEILFKNDDYKISEVKLNGKNYNYVSAESSSYTIKKGYPVLPFFVENFIISDFQKIDFEIQTTESAEERLANILPSPGVIKIGQDFSELEFEENVSYNDDSWEPNQLVQIGEPYTLRDACGFSLRVNPFQYNPKKDLIKIYREIYIVLKKTPIETKINHVYRKKSIPKAFYSLYKNHFKNFNRSELFPKNIEEVGDLVIITADEFSSEANDLMKWKNQKGIPSFLYTYPSDTGAGWENIHQFLQNQYDSSEMTFILLIGDAEFVPPAMGNSGWVTNYTADPVYTLLSGDDQYPEAFIGRLSVSNQQEARSIVNKIINYEKYPNSSISWQNKATGIASDDEFPPFLPDYLLMNTVRERMLSYHYNNFDEIYDPEATTNDVIESINAGVGWVNYLGHGGTTGWNTSSFSVNSVDLLENYEMLPVVLSVACHTGNFAGNDCLAEAWQNAGSELNGCGSIVFQGCSVGQTTAGWVAMDEIINLLTGDEFNSVGGLIVNGCLEAMDYFPGEENGSGVENYQSWHTFGDPSLQVYSDVPQSLTVDHPTFINTETNVISICASNTNGSLENCLTSISQDGIYIDSDFTDENGETTLSLENIIAGYNFLDVVVTAYNHTPYFGEIHIEQTSNDENLLPLVEVYAYPNPFVLNNHSKEDCIVFKYKIRKVCVVDLSVYNGLGQLVKTLSRGKKDGGEHLIKWDGTDKHGKTVSSGTYVYKFKTDDTLITKKIVLIK